MGIGVTRARELEGMIDNCIESGDDPADIIETVKDGIIVAMKAQAAERNSNTGNLQPERKS